MKHLDSVLCTFLYLSLVCYLQYKLPFLFLLAAARNFCISLTYCFLQEKKKASLKAKKSITFNGLQRFTGGVNNWTSLISEKQMRVEQDFLSR